MWHWILRAPALLLLLIPATVLAQRDRDTYSASNQTFEVSGQVRLSESGEPGQKISVQLERFSGGLIDQLMTDDRGRFRFANLQRGFYKVVINVPGFNPAQQEADLTVLFKTFLMFELTADKSKNSPARATSIGVIDARVPAGAQAEYLRGRDALARKSYQDAVAHLEKAIGLYPDFFESNLLLSTAFIDMRAWAKAETVLLHALQLKPDDATVMISLGEVYWREKRFSEAEEILLTGLKLDDKSWQGHFTLGRLYWEMGNIAKAGPPIGRTLQLKPELAEAHLVAGNILLRVSQQQRALVEYKEYLRLSPHGEFAAETREIVQKLQKALAGNN